MKHAQIKNPVLFWAIVFAAFGMVGVVLYKAWVS